MAPKLDDALKTTVIARWGQVGVWMGWVKKLFFNLF